MIASISIGTSAEYYRATDYYLDGDASPGRWISFTGTLGAVNGSQVDHGLFQSLHAGIPLGAQQSRSHRVGGYDVTFSAPKSVSVAYALLDAGQRAAIEMAHARAVEAALAVLNDNAAYARRGKGGTVLEKVDLTAAAFRHNDARPALHSDGSTFADPNLHTHCVVLNLAKRSDGTVGSIDGRLLLRWKMAVGAAYHLSLATELQGLGYGITNLGKNGTFELLGIPEAVCSYFSARRSHIEEALSEAGLSTADAPALAAAVTRTSRHGKTRAEDRFQVWQAKALEQGIDLSTTDLRQQQGPDRPATGDELKHRIRDLPRLLTETEATFDLRKLVAEAYANTVGLQVAPADVQTAIDGLIETGEIVDVGLDSLDQPVFSTPQMMRIEREMLATAADLASRRFRSPDRQALTARLWKSELSDEQREAVQIAAAPEAITVWEGAAGSGKTTALRPLVDAYRSLGCRVIGSATAWRVAHSLRDDLDIDARATDSWLATDQAGGTFLDDNTVLIMDEAGQLSARQMHRLLAATKSARAKLVLVGDREQLQPIAAGPALHAVAQVVTPARIETIVRQHEQWARDAAQHFAKGDAVSGLEAYRSRGLLHEEDGTRAALARLVRLWTEERLSTGTPPLVIAKTNARVAAINAELRAVLAAEGALGAFEITLDTLTPSGKRLSLGFSEGDRIRFQRRLAGLEVINGSIGTITRLSPSDDPHVWVELDGGGGFSCQLLALRDADGIVPFTHAYASTVYSAQGTTVDRTIVFLEPAFDRHDTDVAASRARSLTRFVCDTKTIDAHLRQDRALTERSSPVASEERMAWLAERLARQTVKRTTLTDLDYETARARLSHRHEAGHGLAR